MRQWIFFAGISTLGFKLYAQNSADTTQAVASEIPGLMQQFGSMLNWFIYGIILISVVSIIRMFIVKRRSNDSSANAGSKDRTARQMPTVKKSAFSLPFIIVIALLAVVFWHTWSSSKESIIKESYSNFVSRVYTDKVVMAQFTDRDIYYLDVAQKKYVTAIPFDDPKLVDTLLARGVKVSTAKPPRWTGLISYALPFVLLILFWLFIMRGMSNQNSRAFSFGKSKARLHEASKSKVTFKDVAGVEIGRASCRERV